MSVPTRESNTLCAMGDSSPTAQNDRLFGLYSQTDFAQIKNLAAKIPVLTYAVRIQNNGSEPKWCLFLQIWYEAKD